MKKSASWVSFEFLAPALYRALVNLEFWEARNQALNELLGESNASIAIIQFCNGRARLIAATRPAARLLGLKDHSSHRNLFLQELLGLFPKLVDGACTPVVWKAHDGMQYVLNAIRKNDGAGDHFRLGFQPAVALPFTPAKTEDAARLHAAVQAGLSRREGHVLVLLAHGLGNREIARELRLAAPTVAAHLRNIYQKLHVSNRVEAIQAVRL